MGNARDFFDAHDPELAEERGEREGRRGAPYSPPPMKAGAAALNAYRLAYHRGLDERGTHGRA